MNVELLSKQNLEREKYINAIDFMNLMVFTTKEWIPNIVSYLINEDFEQKVDSYYIDLHSRINKDEHRESFGFDINSRKFLENCYDKGFFNAYVCSSDANKLEGNFYYLIENLQLLDFIENLNIDFKIENTAKNAAYDWSQEQKNSIRIPFESNFEKPNCYQAQLIRQDVFSIIDAACLLSGVSTDDIEKYKNHYKFTDLYSDYIGYKLMFELAITNSEINYQYGSITAIDLQEYLFKTGYTIKGFNDWLNIEPAKPLINYKHDAQLKIDNELLKEAYARIVELENQAALDKAEIEALIQAIPNSDNTSYTTPAINIMNEVITEFWIDYDANDPAPKQSTITGWITNNFEGISDALALNIDKVCRHTSARSGGKYKR